MASLGPGFRRDDGVLGGDETAAAVLDPRNRQLLTAAGFQVREVEKGLRDRVTAR